MALMAYSLYCQIIPVKKTYEELNDDSLTYQELKQIVLNNQTKIDDNITRHIKCGELYHKSAKNMTIGYLCLSVTPFLIWDPIKEPGETGYLRPLGVVSGIIGIVYAVNAIILHSEAKDYEYYRDIDKE